MRPFKFFFALSLGILFFMFIARFVFVALMIAAFMSVVFFIGRKFKNFLLGMDWEDRHYHGQRQYEQVGGYNSWNDAIKFDEMNGYSSRKANVHTIKIQ